MILFLDDSLDRISIFKQHFPSTVVATTAKDCIERLKDPIEWSVVLLDHDLNDEIFVDSDRKDCGMEVVRWICKEKPILGKIIIHTHNYIASLLMFNTLSKASYDVQMIPFDQLLEKINKYKERENDEDTSFGWT